MRHDKFSEEPSHRPVTAARSDATGQLSEGEINFAPSPDEVARKAYFAYVNEGSRPGHEVQHWLSAEADLIAERKMTREHGFHNRT
jgi:hypothetical protein